MPVKPLVERLLHLVERSPRRRRLVAGVFARYYRARGADPVLVSDAVAQAAELSIPATRSTLRWAAALTGGASMPRRYRPERRLRSEQARAVALAAVERRLAEVDDPELQRHRAYLRRDRGWDDPELVSFVTRTLDQRLREHAVAVPANKAMAPEAALDLLCTLHRVLSDGGMRPFLVSGTLLGVVRDGRLLEHDYDLDLGILPGEGSADDVARLLEPVAGLTFEVEDWRVWGRRDDGVVFDVFVHYLERDRFYHATRTHAWWNTPFGLERTTLAGTDLWIPDDVDTYLTENYGRWKAPTVFYHKSFDTPNREYCRSVEALLYLYDLAAAALAANDRFACESAVRELADTFGIDLRHHFGPSPLLAPAPSADGTGHPVVGD